MAPLTLSLALAALRARWWVLLAAALIAGLAALAYTRLPWVDPRWRSSVTVQASGRFDYGNTLALERQLRPLAERVRQLSIMREVDRRLHLDLPAETMLGLVKAEPVQDSNQVRIDVEDADERRAERMALEIAEIYTQQHNASQTGKPTAEQVILTVLDRPSKATLVWPQTRVIVPVAALLGLTLAAAVVVALAALDDTIKTGRDVDAWLGLPLVAVVPIWRGPGAQRAARGTAHAPRPAEAPGLPSAVGRG